MGQKTRRRRGATHAAHPRIPKPPPCHGNGGAAVRDVEAAAANRIAADIRAVDPLFDPADDSTQQQALADADHDHVPVALLRLTVEIHGKDYSYIQRIVTDNDGAWNEENEEFQAMLEGLSDQGWRLYKYTSKHWYKVLTEAIWKVNPVATCSLT